jgi:hypothetical protein
MMHQQHLAPTLSMIATITGTAVKGVLQKAKVTAYKVADGKKGDKLTETTTNNKWMNSTLQYQSLVIVVQLF